MTRPAGSSAAGSSPAADSPASALYVYGVVNAEDAGSLPDEGVGEPPGALRAVVDGALAGVVSPIAEGGKPGRRADLEAHQRVLSEIAATTTVIPMRFGVVMDGEETVRQALLRRHAGTLEALLAAMHGRVQMSLKAFYAGDVLLREVTVVHPEIAERAAEVRDLPDAVARGAKIALGERIAAAVAQRRDADAQRVLDRLAPVVDDVRVESPANERVALNVQVLVSRERRDRLDAVVDGLTEEESGRLAIRYVGPLPPYSFADLSLDAEGAT